MARVATPIDTYDHTTSSYMGCYRPLISWRSLVMAIETAKSTILFEVQHTDFAKSDVAHTNTQVNDLSLSVLVVSQNNKRNQC